MWQIETGRDVLEDSECHILVKRDSCGKELNRVGYFMDRNSANTILQYLNTLNPHASNVLAGYMTVYKFLERYVGIQEYLKLVDPSYNR